MKVDLHVHSDKSPDGIHPVKDIVKEAKRKGIDGVAITDHDYFHSNREKFKDIVVLYGAEITTSLGHAIVLGVRSVSTRNAYELAELIRDEGGAIIPTHLFSLHKPGMGEKGIEIGTCVEKFNGTDPINNVISSIKIKNGTGGSDAHHACGIGLAYTEFPDFGGEDEILLMLEKGKFTARLSLNPAALPLYYIKRYGRKFPLRV
ncbi:MAG: PHP domain-containing protein [Candidatus Micrarchaeia archaeon]